MSNTTRTHSINTHTISLIFIITSQYSIIMKTRNFINKTTGIASMISVSIYDVIARAINELMGIADVPVMEPCRVKVPVRVQRSEFSDRTNH